jgi:AcrR family transcriptional regulator
MTTAHSPRERNERGHGDRLRVELLDALARLVGDDDRMAPLPVSLREVAREAGVTAPAIYRHFATKEDLGAAAVEDGFARLLAAMQEAGASAEADPAAALAAQARAYCRFARDHRGHFRLMLRWIGPAAGEAAGPSAGARGAADLARQWRRAVTRLREQGIELTRDEDDAATLVWSTVHGRLTLDAALGTVWPDPAGHGVEDFVDRFVDSLVATARRS